MRSTRFYSYLIPLFIAMLCSGYAGAAQAQAPDENFDIRAQEVIDGLTRQNGLMGWEAAAPSTWPLVPFDVDGAGASSAAYMANGAAFGRDVPASLLGLRLANMNLGRGGDFGGLYSLLSLEVAGNDFRALNLEGDSALRRLNATKNQLAQLNVSHSPELIWLTLSSNRLTALDLAGNPQLMELSVSMNQLTQLDVSRNPRLVILEAMNNQLSDLSVLQNPQLARLLVSYNQLEELFVGYNPALSQLGARDNKLTRLDLSANPELREVTLSRNALRDLDLSRNNRLENLTVDENNINILDLSANHALAAVQVQGNPLVELRLGANQMSRLETLNVDGCRLPLSRLYPLSGLAKNRGRLGTQDKALFEEITIEYKDGAATLDLSAEAAFGGEPTEFLALNEKKRRLRPSEYRVENGILHFARPGRYVVMMTNPKVFSSDINQLTGRVHAIKAKVYSGVINAVETR